MSQVENRITKVAIVGCGAIVEQLHLPLLVQRSDIELVALVDNNADRAKELANKFSVPSSLTQVADIDGESVDAAFIATPNVLHGPQALELLHKGIHVLVEKPMAVSAAQCDDLIKAADAAGVLIGAGLTRRFLEASCYAKWAIESGLLGEIEAMNVSEGFVYSWPAGPALLSSDTSGGGVLMDLGAHTMDQILWWFGDVKECALFEDSMTGVEADCHIDLIFESGVRGSVELSRTRDLRSTAIIRGSRAVLEVDMVGNGVKLHFAGSNAQLMGSAELLTATAPTALPATELMRREHDSFFAAVRGEAAYAISPAESRAAVALTERLYNSRQPLLLPWTCSQAGEISEASVAATSQCDSALFGKTVLVTGGTGFIGGRLIERLLLEEGAKVRALVRQAHTAVRLARLPIEIVVAELTDSEAVAKALSGCDLVVNCAHDSEIDKKTMAYRILEGTQNLCELVKQAKVGRFVHLSTSSVYGPTLDGELDESTLRRSWSHPYTLSKRKTEALVLQMYQDGLPAVILQPTVVYGPYCQAWTHQPARDLLSGVVPLVDGGAGLSNAVYVDDLVDAIYAAALTENIEGETFLVSGNEKITWKAFYSAFEAVLGQSSTREVDSAQLEQALAREEREGRLTTRIKRYLLDPSVFWPMVKAPPHGVVLRKLGSLIPQGLKDKLFSRVSGKPGGGSALAPQNAGKPLLIPNQTLLKLYQAKTHIRIDKATNVLGYEPKMRFSDGMKITGEYLRWAEFFPAEPAGRKI